MQMASAVIPKVVVFGFTNYESTPKSRSAKCRTCGVKIADGAQTTWNQQVFQHNLLVTLRCVTSLTNLMS